MSATLVLDRRRLRRFQKKLDRLDRKVKRKITRKAITKSAQVLTKSTKAAAPIGPTGRLKRSIAWRVRNYRASQTMVGIVGSRLAGKQKKPPKRPNVAPHAHLVEKGTAQRTRKKIGGRYAGAERTPDGPKSRSTGRVAGQGFMARVVTAHRRAHLQIVAGELRKGILTEARRR